MSCRRTRALHWMTGAEVEKPRRTIIKSGSLSVSWPRLLLLNIIIISIAWNGRGYHRGKCRVGCNRAFCWSMGMLLMMMFVESTSEAVYGQLNGLTWPLVSPLIERARKSSSSSSGYGDMGRVEWVGGKEKLKQEKRGVGGQMTRGDDVSSAIIITYVV